LIQQIAKSILNNLFLTSLLHVPLTNSWLFIIHCAVCWIRYCIVSLWNGFHTGHIRELTKKLSSVFI